MSWGDLYYRLKSQWDNTPVDDRMKSRNWGSYVDESGQRMYRDMGGSEDRLSNYLDFGMGDNSAMWGKFEQQQSAWDPRDFERAFLVLPLDDPFSGNGTYTDARIAPQGKGNLLQFLNFVSGNQGGQIVYDPLIGRVWVPNNKSMFDPYRDFSKSGDFVTHFMDSGGLVKVFASLILGGALAPMVDGGGTLLNALGDVTGIAPSVSSGIVDVPYDVGGNLVNNPEVFSPDVPYDVGQNLVNNPSVFDPSTPLDTLRNLPAPKVGADPITGDPVRVVDYGPPDLPAAPPAGTVPTGAVNPQLLKLIPAAAAVLPAIQRIFGSTTAALTPAQLYQNQQAARLATQQSTPSTTSWLPLVAIALAFAGH